jgi:hypothetical protein
MIAESPFRNRRRAAMMPRLTATVVMIFAMMTTARGQDEAAVALDQLMSPGIQKRPVSTNSRHLSEINYEITCSPLCESRTKTVDERRCASWLLRREWSRIRVRRPFPCQHVPRGIPYRRLRLLRRSSRVESTASSRAGRGKPSFSYKTARSGSKLLSLTCTDMHTARRS